MDIYTRQPGCIYIASLSYGKDSIAMLEAIKQLKLPLDKIIHIDVWATDTIPADLPPMIEFKKEADKKIKDMYGIEVEHICAIKAGTIDEKLTYEKLFYKISKRKNKTSAGTEINDIRGFPMVRGNWCNSDLKRVALKYKKFFNEQGERLKIIQYLGIAPNETNRVLKNTKDNIVLPLVEIGWDESYCKDWCMKNDLLSPIYTSKVHRGGCWFCHNSTVDELRNLRKNYPELWNKLLQWDKDSPVTFSSKGKSVHDYDLRFQCEDEGKCFIDKRFKWNQVNEWKDKKNNG